MFVSTGYVEDFHEDLVHYNIAPLYSKETTTVEGASTEVYSSTHSQAINCQRLLNKQKQHYMFQLATPLTNIRSFLPSNIEYGFRLFFTEPNRFFTSGTACKPVYKIDECKLYVKCILFKEAILGRIERRLQSSPLVYPFLADFVKTYSVERGHTDATINLAIRSPFEIAYVMLFKNTDYIGNYKHNLYIARISSHVTAGFVYSIDARLEQQSWGFYKSEKIIKIGIIVPKLLRKTCPAVLLKISYFNQTAFKGFLKIASAAMLCEPGTAGGKQTS